MSAEFAAQMTPKRFEILNRRWKERINQSLQNKTIEPEFATDYLNRLNLLKESMDIPARNSYTAISSKVIPIMNKNRRLSGLMDLETTDNINRPTHRYINNLVKNPKSLENPEAYGKLTPLAFEHIKSNYPNKDTIGISGLNNKLDDYYQKVSGLPRQTFEDVRQLIRNRQEILPGAVQGKISEIK